jgi:hypothetical protein
MKFTKMQGAGNDYVYVNGFEERLTNPAEVARRVSDRHFGIGSDGLILILPSTVADVRLQMFNADARNRRCAATESAVWPNTPMTTASWRKGRCRRNRRRDPDLQLFTDSRNR